MKLLLFISLIFGFSLSQTQKTAEPATLPLKYKKQTSIALAHYPELAGVEINFIQKDIKTTMACQPDISKILLTGKRVYNIIIDTDKNGEGIALSEAPFDAQIGVIGHELAHIIDYESKTTSELIQTGIGYLFTDYKRELEHNIDAITIQHGLGTYLYAWANFALNESAASDEYKNFKRDIYMKPNEIKLVVFK